MNLFIRIYNKINHLVLGVNRTEKQSHFFNYSIHDDITFEQVGVGKNVLVIGIYLTDYSNQAEHLIAQFSKSKQHNVDQKWIAIGKANVPHFLAENTILHLKEKTPKFKLLNEIISEIDIEAYDYIIFTDDDIAIHDNFIDVYINVLEKYDLKIAQPSRVAHSFNMHNIVLQRKNCVARVTNFVEIGPIFSFHKSIFQEVLPFPKNAEMGWGLDYIWPKIAEKNNFSIGIVDLITVDHSYRPQSKTYSNQKSMEQMDNLLNDFDNNRCEKKIVIKKML